MFKLTIPTAVVAQPIAGNSGVAQRVSDDALRVVGKVCPVLLPILILNQRLFSKLAQYPSRNRGHAEGEVNIKAFIQRLGEHLIVDS